MEYDGNDDYTKEEILQNIKCCKGQTVNEKLEISRMFFLMSP